MKTITEKILSSYLQEISSIIAAIGLAKGIGDHGPYTQNMPKDWKITKS